MTRAMEVIGRRGHRTLECSVLRAVDEYDLRGILGTMLKDGLFDPVMPVQIRWGDLPHWRQDGGLYFITFRLSDSLPQILLRQWKREQQEWRKQHQGVDRETLMRHSVEQQRRIERWLDKGYGSCVLSETPIRQIVADAIRHFDGERYELGEFTVALNHVHALIRTALGVDLSNVLYSLKRFTATQILKVPRVRTAFDGCRHLWQKESFDHLVRNAKSLERIRRYIKGHEQLMNRQKERDSG